MTSQFSGLIDQCFSAFGSEAVYTSSSGEEKTISVVSKQPDQTFGFGDTQIHTEVTMFDVRVSDVPNPEPGERLSIDGTDYQIQGEPVRDSERLVWTIGAELIQ
ncbi:head-tail joining protein [Magnetococcales bacterium HHB-1]